MNEHSYFQTDVKLLQEDDPPDNENALGNLTGSSSAELTDDIKTVAADFPDSKPPVLAAEAFHGLAGEIVKAHEPHTEADPAAILFQLLTTFGCAATTGPHFLQEATKHQARLFVAIVGKSAKARKGTSWSIVRSLFERADLEFSKRIVSGASSGEGIIHHVRDGSEVEDSKGKIRSDPGVTDKRMLLFEGEFAQLLRVTVREGNTVSPVIRNAWDGGRLQTLTKNSP